MSQRRGRRARHYTTSWGETILGLCRRANGRFYPVGRNDIAFGSEEVIAVHRFRQWQAEQEQEETPPSTPVDLTLRPDTISLLFPEGDSDLTDDEYAPTMRQLAEVLEHSTGISFPSTIEAIRQAERQRLRRLIFNDPRQAAIDLDVPHLAHYPTIPDAPQFTLRELGEFYLENKRNRRGELLDAKHKKNSRRWWEGFCDSVGVRHARDLTSTLVRRYYDEVMGKFDAGFSPAYVKSRFVKVRAILNYGIKFTDDKVDLRRALDMCAILTPPEEEADPMPIDPADFRRLLDHADAQMKAILLLGLNAAMHNGEVASTLTKDLNLNARTLSARRSKTRTPRVAYLWERTVDAIRAYRKELPHKSPHLFVSRTGKAITGERIRQRFVTLRRKAGISDTVTYEGLRDAAYTIADDVDAHHAKFIAGHKSGESDKYVLRQALHSKVKACCEAIEAFFFEDAAVHV